MLSITEDVDNTKLCLSAAGVSQESRTTLEEANTSAGTASRLLYFAIISKSARKVSSGISGVEENKEISDMESPNS